MPPRHDPSQTRPRPLVTRPRRAAGSPEPVQHLPVIRRPPPSPVEPEQWAALPPPVRAELEAVVANAVAIARDDHRQHHVGDRPRRTLANPELLVALMLTLVVVFAIVSVLAIVALAVVAA